MNANEQYRIPFPVKQALIYQDRVFAIDEEGMLRWSKKYHLDMWYEEESEEIAATYNYTSTDSGWWQIENEPIEKIAISQQVLLVRTEKSQHVLTGNCPNNYCMEKLGDLVVSDRWYGKYIEGVGIVVMTKEDWEKANGGD